MLWMLWYLDVDASPCACGYGYLRVPRTVCLMRMGIRLYRHSLSAHAVCACLCVRVHVGGCLLRRRRKLCAFDGVRCCVLRVQYVDMQAAASHSAPQVRALVNTMLVREPSALTDGVARCRGQMRH